MHSEHIVEHVNANTRKMAKQINGYAPVPKEILKEISSTGELNRSEAVNEILNRHPSFIEKWSLAIFICVLLVLVVTAWMIWYPDRMELKGGHARVEQSNTPNYVEVLLAKKNAGSVSAGTPVEIFFKDYPRTQFGFVSGNIESIGKGPTGEWLMASIRLENGLRTNLNRSIQFREDLEIDAIFLNGKVRLLEKIFRKATGTVSP